MKPPFLRVRRRDMLRILDRLGYRPSGRYHLACPARGNWILPPDSDGKYLHPGTVQHTLDYIRLTDADFARQLEFDPKEDPRHHRLPEDAELRVVAGNRHLLPLYQSVLVRDLAPALRFAGYRRVPGQRGLWASGEGESLQLPRRASAELSPRQVWWALCVLRVSDREFARLRQEAQASHEAA